MSSLTKLPLLLLVLFLLVSFGYSVSPLSIPSTNDLEYSSQYKLTFKQPLNTQKDAKYYIIPPTKDMVDISSKYCVNSSGSNLYSVDRHLNGYVFVALTTVNAETPCTVDATFYKSGTLTVTSPLVTEIAPPLNVTVYHGYISLKHNPTPKPSTSTFTQELTLNFYDTFDLSNLDLVFSFIQDSTYTENQAMMGLKSTQDYVPFDVAPCRAVSGTTVGTFYRQTFIAKDPFTGKAVGDVEQYKYVLVLKPDLILKTLTCSFDITTSSHYTKIKVYPTKKSHHFFKLWPSFRSSNPNSVLETPVPPYDDIYTSIHYSKSLFYSRSIGDTLFIEYGVNTQGLEDVGNICLAVDKGIISTNISDILKNHYPASTYGPATVSTSDSTHDITVTFDTKTNTALKRIPVYSDVQSPTVTLGLCDVTTSPLALPAPTTSPSNIAIYTTTSLNVVREHYPIRIDFEYINYQYLDSLTFPTPYKFKSTSTRPYTEPNGGISNEIPISCQHKHVSLRPTAFFDGNKVTIQFLKQTDRLDGAKGGNVEEPISPSSYCLLYPIMDNDPSTDFNTNSPIYINGFMTYNVELTFNPITPIDYASIPKSDIPDPLNPLEISVAPNINSPILNSIEITLKNYKPVYDEQGLAKLNLKFDNSYIKIKTAYSLDISNFAYVHHVDHSSSQAVVTLRIDKTHVFNPDPQYWSQVVLVVGLDFSRYHGSKTKDIAFTVTATASSKTAISPIVSFYVKPTFYVNSLESEIIHLTNHYFVRSVVIYHDDWFADSDNDVSVAFDSEISHKYEVKTMDHFDTYSIINMGIIQAGFTPNEMANIDIILNSRVDKYNMTLTFTTRSATHLPTKFSLIDPYQTNLITIPTTRTVSNPPMLITPSLLTDAGEILVDGFSRNSLVIPNLWAKKAVIPKMFVSEVVDGKDVLIYKPSHSEKQILTLPPMPLKTSLPLTVKNYQNTTLRVEVIDVIVPDTSNLRLHHLTSRKKPETKTKMIDNDMKSTCVEDVYDPITDSYIHQATSIPHKDYLNPSSLLSSSHGPSSNPSFNHHLSQMAVSNTENDEAHDQIVFKFEFDFYKYDFNLTVDFRDLAVNKDTSTFRCTFNVIDSNSFVYYNVHEEGFYKITSYQGTYINAYGWLDGTCVFTPLTTVQMKDLKREFSNSIYVTLYTNSTVGEKFSYNSTAFNVVPLFSTNAISSKVTVRQTSSTGLKPNEIDEILNNYQDAIIDTTGGGVDRDDISVGDVTQVPSKESGFDTDIDVIIKDDSLDFDIFDDVNDKFIENVGDKWKVEVAPPKFKEQVGCTVDQCGGKCTKCKLGKTCKVHSDCLSTVCDEKTKVCSVYVEKKDDNASFMYTSTSLSLLIFTVLFVLF